MNRFSTLLQARVESQWGGDIPQDIERILHAAEERATRTFRRLPIDPNIKQEVRMKLMEVLIDSICEVLYRERTGEYEEDWDMSGFGSVDPNQTNGASHATLSDRPEP